MMEISQCHPEVDFANGVLRMWNISDFDEVDVLFHDIASKGNIRPLVVRGRIPAEAFTCSLPPEIMRAGWPLGFIIRLTGLAGHVAYMHVLVNRVGNRLTITSVVL